MEQGGRSWAALGALGLGLALGAGSASAEPSQPWQDQGLSPEARAKALVTA